jgi:ATP-binding cassette, subfamily B, bacterial PglK
MNNSFAKIYNLLSSSKRKESVVLFGFILIGAAFEVLGVGFMLPVIVLLTDDNLAVSYPVYQQVLDVLDNPSREIQILIVMLVLVSIYFIKNMYLAFLAWWQTRFSFDLQVELSHRLFAIYLKQPYTFHLQRNSAQLFRNITSEVNEFVGRGVNPIMSLLAEIIVLLSIVILLLLVEPVGALVVSAVLLIASWGFYQSTRGRIKRWGEKRLYHDGLRVQHLNQGLGGVKDIKLLGREAEFITQFHEHTSKTAQMTKNATVLQKLPRLWLELLAVVGLVLLVFIMLAQGHEISSIVPIMGLFAVAAFRLMPSVNRIITDMQYLRYGLPAIDNLYDDFKLSIPEIVNSTNTNKFKKEICLTDITYHYPDTSNSSLSSVAIKVSRGEFIGIIGSSGCGKSTLMDVILGLLTPCSGKVVVDEVDIKQNIRGWQDQIGYVPQTIYLTDDTLRRNIAFGLPDEQIDDSAVECAILAAQLDYFVSDLTDGVETMVGERGVRLSGGQRQRIGIARALYHDPEVLVLDEATSALDSATEENVMQAIMALHGKKTILIVAHRLSTIENCDRVYRLDKGKVVQEGKPSEIISSAELVAAS